jgi:hypothetical protein
VVPRGNLPDCLAFQFAKGRFAIRGKDVRDGAFCPRLDQLVRVQKFKAKRFGHETADGGFAGAHETDEREVGKPAMAVVHGDELTQTGFGRTPQIQALDKAAVLGRITL